jgi:pSer/pThr/pTyr-binding forkhead associated (FHA) protein
MKLIIEDEEGRRTTVPFVRDEVSIGRQEGNTARLVDRNISRRHALVINQNGAVIIEDLNSFNGVRVNGERINGRAPVREGDLIQIGDYDLALAGDEQEAADGRGKTQPIFLTSDQVAKAQAAAPADASAETSPARITVRRVIPAPPLPGDALEEIPKGERPRLVLLNTPAVGREIVIDRAEMRIGHGDSELVIDPQALGKEDVRLRRDGQGGWHVMSVGSAGGVKVNGQRQTEAPLSAGDVLQVGLVRMRFIAPGERFSLAGFSEEQRRLQRPVQALFILVALLFGALLVYLLWMRPREVRARPSAQHDSLALPATQQQDQVAPAVGVPDQPAIPPAPATAETGSHRGKNVRPSRRHRAADEAEAAAEEPEDRQTSRQGRSTQLYEEGVALISDADYVAALAKLQKALEIEPSMAEAHKAMGVCYAHLQEADKGAFHYEQYLKLNPGAEDAPEVRRMLADYYRTRGNPEPE